MFVSKYFTQYAKVYNVDENVKKIELDNLLHVVILFLDVSVYASLVLEELLLITKKASFIDCVIITFSS